MAEFRQMHVCEATFLSPFKKKKKNFFSIPISETTGNINLFHCSQTRILNFSCRVGRISTGVSNFCATEV